MIDYKNFTLKKNKKTDFGVELLEFVHKSGARIYYLKNSDTNRVFAINFKTPPNSDKGEPHILEHSVLVGSKKFDLGGKEPFAELARKRMATYLNAYTMPHATSYPIASINEKDFLYMMELYLDAVFAPKFVKDENIFRQEAWRVEKDTKENYYFSGVVLGEMKSRLSSSQAIFYRQLTHKLFPDSFYEFESGGDPNEIINLSHKELVDFYKKHYTAKNAQIYLYGKLNLHKVFSVIDEYLLHANKGKEYKLQVKVPSKKRKEKITIPGKKEKDSAISISFYGEPAKNIKDNIILNIIFNVLTSDESSPIKEVFNKSKIKALPVFDIEKYTKINIFSLIFFNVNKKDLTRLEKLVFSVLDKIKKEGLDKKRLQKELNKSTLYFEKLKFATNKGEKFLNYIERFWNFDTDIFAALAIKKIFKEIQEEFEKDPDLFDKYFDKYFASAKNYLILQAEAKDKDPFAKLNKKQNTLNKANKKQKQIFEEQIKEFQKFKNSAGKSIIYATNLSAYKFTPRDWTREVLKNRDFYFKKINSNLVSASIFFDLSHFTMNELQAVSVLLKSFDSFEFENSSRKQMDLKKAGVVNGPNFSLTYINSVKEAKVFLKTSFEFLQKNKNNAKQILNEYINQIKIDEKILQKDLTEYLDNQKDALRYFVDASNFAKSRALAPFSLKYALIELTSGISFVQFAAELIQSGIDKKYFAQIYKKMFANKSYKIVTARNLEKDFFNLLPSVQNYKKASWQNPFTKESVYFYVKHKGFYSNVLASSANVSSKSYALGSLITYKYFWEKIREEGGAYGGRCIPFVFDSLFLLSSHSDPRQQRTFSIFETLPEFSLDFFDKEDINGAIASNMLRFDEELSELQKGEEAFLLDMQKMKFERVLKLREQLLKADKKSLQNELVRIKNAIKKDQVKISLGGMEKPEIHFDKIIKLDF